MSKLKGCIIRGCHAEASTRIICDQHLNSPSEDKIKFSETIRVNPTVFEEKTKNPANQLVKAIQLTSPVNIIQQRKPTYKTKEKLRKSSEHNEECTEVHYLKKIDEGENKFYTPNEEYRMENGEQCHSTRNFQTFQQKKTTNQLFISEDTNELIFFLPGKDHQDACLVESQNKKLQRTIIKSFLFKQNQVKQGSKKRRIQADKWVLFGLKWSPYENGADKELGCTNYAGANDRMERAMKRGIANAVSVFSLPLSDLYLRQKRVMDHLVETSSNDLGLSVAVGLNYRSSSHTDRDMGYTFAGSFSSCRGKVGNSFLFPTYNAKIAFPQDNEDINMFCFNPTMQHCAEGFHLDEGNSYLFSIYTKTSVIAKCGFV